jgi:ABC transport system ATP-binding/permease protein
MLLVATDVSRTHGVRELFRGVSLSVEADERVALIGPNGAGKSTLLRTLAGLEPADHGEVRLGRGAVAVYAPQVDRFEPGCSCLQVCATAAMRAPAVHGDAHEAEALAGMILGRCGFDSARMEMQAQSLSGGWQRRLSIARALSEAGGQPDLLLLDEPTNHLDVGGIRWLEELLCSPSPELRARAAVFVTHDRAFLQRVATRIVELSSAYADGTFQVEGDYREFVRRRREFLEGEERAQAALANEVRRDEEWLSRGAQARRTKAKGRIDDSADRREQLAALSARNQAAAATGAEVDFAGTGRRTRKLVAARGVAKAMGGRTLFEGLDLEIGPGTRLALLGANGSGKTTLLRVLCGELAPDQGVVERADPAPRMAVLTQQRRELPGDTLLRDAIAPPGDMVRFQDRAMHITAWARRFLFRTDQLIQPLSSLSGGELARAHLARLMLEPADVLVLDEPTNDLDIPTLEVLEESVQTFPGAVLLVTHDRAMLERLATAIAVLGGPGASVRQVASLSQALAALEQNEEAVDAAARSARSAAAAESRAPSAAVAPTEPTRKRLGYMEQRELDGMEARIHQAEAELKKTEAEFEKAAVTGDHVRLSALSQTLERHQLAVAALYERWAELDSRRS